MKYLKSFFYWIFFWHNLITFVPILLIFALIVHSEDIKNKVIFAFCSYITYTLGIKTNIVYLDYKTKDLFPVIFTANHVSFFDLFISGSTLPGYPRGFELHSHFNKPFYGWFISAFGQTPIDSRNKGKLINSMKTAAKLLNYKKRNFFITPEGTRTRTGDIEKFNNGAFYLSFYSQTPIVPVIYKNLFSINNPTSLLINPGTVNVIIGKPFYPNDFENKEEMALHVRHYMQNILADNLENYKG